MRTYVLPITNELQGSVKDYGPNWYTTGAMQQTYWHRRYPRPK